MKHHSCLLALTAALAVNAAELTIQPANAVIVIPEKTDAMVKVAAAEFQRHVKMMTAVELPIVHTAANGAYPFIFGTPEGATLKTEEARWEVTADATRLYGDSVRVKYTNDPKIWSDQEKSGDLTAVYDFLERQLGFLFLAPGPAGTAFEPAATLKLKTGSHSWEPGMLINREMRPVCPVWLADAYQKRTDIPAAFKLTKEQYKAKNQECRVWLKQQRMGGSEKFSFGHAFCYWWGLYGKEHPEYFALFKGKRYPARPNRPDTIKMCPSSKGFQEQIVKNWLAKSPRPKYINVCENDWGDYCECEDCRKLDMPPQDGNAWDVDLTDRYLHFANAVLALARKHDPEVCVCMYAYANYRFPPRREHVADGVLLGFVPSMFAIDKVDSMYKQWRKMGAKLMYQRPNDQHCNCGLPMGIEKLLFDHFQVGIKNNIFGTDYDTIHGFWETTGIADYILARGHIDPSKPFDYWMDEYCSAYGNAANDVKEYYAYWRENVLEKRLLPARQAIVERGRYGNFRRGLMMDLHKYYFAEDFDKTDAIIARGLAKKLTANQRKRLETLKLSNIHCRMTYDTIIAKGDDKCAAAVRLLKFRVENKDNLNMQWDTLCRLEKEFGDITGLELAKRVGDYTVGKALPTWSYFMPDVDNVGDKEQWYAMPPTQFSTIWYSCSVEYPWENQPSYRTEALEKVLKNYDGIAWYGQSIRVPAEWKGKEIALIFGAVDESAWVYVNGKLCGTHPYKNPEDWQTPFAIRIDSAVNWDAPSQTVVVKVEDKAGLGGIWRPVTLVMR